jgi:hypothetical protein
MHRRVARRNLRRGDKNSVVLKVNFFRGDQPHVAVNAGAGVVARVGEAGMIHAHGEHVVAAKFCERREVARKT